MPAWERLREWSREVAGVHLGDDVVGRLRRFAEVLRLWNRRLALVARVDLDTLVDRHIADSVFAAAHCSGDRRIADLGSGAGFPGLVIALLHPEAQVTLIEARGKKVSFLEEACRVVAIGNAQPVHGRIEVVAAHPPHRAAYDKVTSRALADLDTLCSLAAPLAAPGASLLSMRSASAAVPTSAWRVEYTLPDGTPRALLTLPLSPQAGT